MEEVVVVTSGRVVSNTSSEGDIAAERNGRELDGGVESSMLDPGLPCPLSTGGFGAGSELPEGRCRGGTIASGRSETGGWSTSQAS